MDSRIKYFCYKTELTKFLYQKKKKRNTSFLIKINIVHKVMHLMCGTYSFSFSYSSYELASYLGVCLI